MKLTLAGLSRFDFLGVLLLRVGLGALIAFHGFPILIGGPDAWEDTGTGAAILGLQSPFFLYAGLASAVLQVFGGAMLVLGCLTRGTALFLSIPIGIAFANLIDDREFGLSFFAYLQILLACLALVFVGPGRVSLDRKGI